MNKSKFSTLTQTLMAIAFTVMPVHQSHAAPLGALPNAPLFLSTLVDPNIFFTMDDSGSMGFGIISDDGLGGFGQLGGYDGLPIIDGRVRSHYDNVWSYTFGFTIQTLPPSNGTKAAWDLGWIFRNHLGNKLYYNPEFTYIPWVGTDADGDPLYENATPTSIPRYPWPNPPGNETINLTTDFNFDGNAGALYIPTYFIWDDANDDEIMDLNERTEVIIKQNATSDATFFAGDGVTRRTYAEEIVNFANWFQYYRTREYALKAAIGEVFFNADSSRMGLDIFIGGLKRKVLPMSDDDNKRELLEIFYAVNTEVSIGGTPARTAMGRVDAYFRQTNSDAPIVSEELGGECQQNFNILMSDGYWNRGGPNVGNTDIDAGSGSVYDGNADQSNDGGNYADAYQNTLADIAMNSYEKDLRGDLDDRVSPTPGVDLAEHQHLVTYSIAFGLEGVLDPEVAPTDDTFAGWPDPFTNDAAKIDDLWHAAYNGRGKFLSADNAGQLQAALNRVTVDITKRSGTASAVAINSSRLSTESVIYLAEFNSDSWFGDLQAFQITDTSTGSLADQEGVTQGQEIAEWTASGQLTDRDPTSRNIITYDNTSSDGVIFQWDEISPDMKSDLKTNVFGNQDSDAIGEARLNYIRGDRSLEGSAFRKRISLLGDIVNSGPVFVGPPNLSWSDDAPFPTGANAYSTYKNSAAKDRQKIVYVGANDGMLHGFNDETGKEEFAYVPGIVSSSNLNEGLHYLTEPDYQHQYYVDLTPTVSDIFISTSVAGLDTTAWKTVLIGGMRGGGRGIFALDVTNPLTMTETEANAASTVLWEFTSADDNDLGYTYSRPSIALTNAGTWVAIFGNGYNDTGAGEAQLFIVDIQKGIDGTWSSGDYVKLNTKAGSTASPNGLAAPALADLDGNGTVDRVYAGDLEGNMWAFDLSDSSQNNWEVSGIGNGKNAVPDPLFTAPAGQPITAKPVLSKHPTQPNSSSPSNSPNLMVFFGTGQYLVEADKDSEGTESFFGVWDTAGDNNLTKSDLIQQTFDTSFSGGRVLTQNAVDYSVDHGWYFNFPAIDSEEKERAVTSPIARQDVVFFNTFIPKDDPCVPGGFGFRYAVDMTTGGSPGEPSIDSNNDGEINEDDLQTNNAGDESTLAAIQQDGYLPEPVFIEDLAFTAKTAIKIKTLPNIPVGRFSWQELIQ